MYSDYFDDPEDQSGSTVDDVNGEDEIMDDIETDENSMDEEETGANKLNIDDDNDHDKDDGPKSTLEKQQEKVS